MRKVFQMILILLCCASVAGYIYTSRQIHQNDSNAYPTITMVAPEVTISVTDGNKVILAGISAQDPEDGDVASSLVVESLSNMVDHSYRNAVICAFDGNDHVVKCKRRVIYRDYHSPVFSLKGPLSAPPISLLR